MTDFVGVEYPKMFQNLFECFKRNILKCFLLLSDRNVQRDLTQQAGMVLTGAGYKKCFKTLLFQYLMEIKKRSHTGLRFLILVLVDLNGDHLFYPFRCQ
mgnify:CR=1 FL=1